MSEAFELTERLTPDIVAQRVGEQCGLIKPPEAGHGRGGVGGQPGRGKRGAGGNGNWKRWSWIGDDFATSSVRCRRGRRWITKRKAAAFTTEWMVGGRDLDAGRGWRLVGVQLRLRITTAADGYGVEARLFQRGKRSRVLALVDGRMSEADAEAIRERLRAERIVASLA